MIALTTAVVVLAVLVLICVFALVDQYRTLEVIRAELGLNDTPHRITLPDTPLPAPSAAGLPPALDRSDRAIVVFMSTMCSTCETIAKRLRGEVPGGLHLVLEARSADEAAEWTSRARLPKGSVIFDEDGHIAGRLHVDVSPSAIVFQEGVVVAAQTIPSFRQLGALLAEPQSPLPVSVRPEVKAGNDHG